MSSKFTNIYQVLQHIINDERVNRKVFLHADWKCLNSILGLKSASSLNPCPICLVKKSELNTIAPMRYMIRVGSKAQKHEPLIQIHPQRIVPLPLHIFLGLCNKIIRDIVPSIIDPSSSSSSPSSIKTATLTSSVGASRVHDLTGPELSRYIKTNQYGELMNIPSSSTIIIPHILQYWMEQLHLHLLHREKWNIQQKVEFSSFVSEFTGNWEAVTNTNLTPKCHMLLHVIPFIKHHHHLGKYGESQLESYHARFRYTEQHNHINRGRNAVERIRRTLADKSLIAVAPFVVS
jgi:hypothetical protein